MQWIIHACGFGLQSLHIPSHLISRTAVIQNVDIEYSDRQLNELIGCNQFVIKSVKKNINRRVYISDEVKYFPRSSVLVVFEGQILHAYVLLWKSATVVSCPERKRQTGINELMASHNMS